MKISLSWLREFVDLKGMDSSAIAECLTSRGIEVESIQDLGRGLDHVVSAKILKKDKHPQADRLSLCHVSTGQGSTLEIVCGAQNMKEGDIVALAQIGAILPNGMKIAQTKIRGVLSHGMLCSESELGLSKESDGILILPPTTKLGAPLARVLGMEDVILELSITPNRGDCLSHLGIARELAAAKKFKITSPKIQKLSTSKKSSEWRTEISQKSSTSQFWAVVLDGVKVGPSPEPWVRKLKAMGSRSINNVVDATNIVLFEMGHPVHAYDRDRLSGKKLVARVAKKGEKLALLDDTSVTLEGFETVISDEPAGKPVALAGVMGGSESSVSHTTTKLLLECAVFSPSAVRKASRFHQKITDSSYRFERGVDSEDAPLVLGRLVQLIQEMSGPVSVMGVCKSEVSKSKRESIAVESDYFETFLGCEISKAESQRIFKDLGCEVSASKVIPPSWRNDLRSKEDLAEEIARSIGYDRIPTTLPRLTSMPAGGKNKSYEQMGYAKKQLQKLGLVESIRYAFTSAKELESLGFREFLKLGNPLSEEQEALVPSLLPGLISAAQENLHHHFGSDSLSLRWFELRPTFHKSENGESDTKIPETKVPETKVKEEFRLAMLVSGSRWATSLRSEEAALDFFDLKGILENFFESLGLRRYRILPLSTESSSHLFHPGLSARLEIAGKDAGCFGLLHPKIEQDRKIKAKLWLADLAWDVIVKESTVFAETKKVSDWPQYPGIERDFALVVRNSVTAGAIESIASREGRPLAKVVKIFDTYRGSQVAEGMTSVAVRVIFLDEARSLQEAEVEEVSAKILARWKSELGAELRG